MTDAAGKRAALVAIAAVSALNEALQMLALMKGSTAMAHVDFGGHPTVLTSDMDELELTEKLSDLVITTFDLPRDGVSEVGTPS